MRLHRHFVQFAARQGRWAVFGLVLLSGLAGIGAGQFIKHSISGSVSVVEGDSMAPTFHDGARIFSAPITTSLQRGDIVMLDDHRGGYALKRIIALPGETLEICRGHVFVNTRMLEEPYLPRNMFTLQDEHSNQSKFQLSNTEYFVMGDNRFGSIDSRAYGPINGNRITGRIPVPAETLRASVTSYRIPVNGQRMIHVL
jgi:signal peptidase I